MRFIFLTMDGNHNGALREAAALLCRDQGIQLGLGLYDATRLRSEDDWHRLAEDAASADFVFGSMLFGEEYVRPLARMLQATETPVCVITSNPALIRLTHIGKFDMRKKDSEEREESPLARWAKKFRPKGGHGEGQRQLAMLRNMGKILQHIPGKARDLAAYINVHQYWMHASPENLRRMLVMLVEHYVPGYGSRLKIEPAIEYPDLALFHPDAPTPFKDLPSYQRWMGSRRSLRVERSNPLRVERSNPLRVERSQGRSKGPNAQHPTYDNQRPNAQTRNAQRSNAQRPTQGTVGLLSLRTVALSGNTAHLDALVHALEARGLEVRMAYSAGLDFRPAIKAFFTTKDEGAQACKRWWQSSAPAAEEPDRTAAVDVLLNGAGFSLVGGMAESRPDEAVATLSELDVAYLDLIPLAFQRVEEWLADDGGLSPIQIAMNVAIPELDAAAEPLVFGGPTSGRDRFVAQPAQIALAADRIAKRVKLRRAPNAAKKLGIVLFNFPPTLGNAGTAAYLDVFAGVHRLMGELREQGYTIDVPETPEELRRLVVEENAQRFGTDGSVGARLSLADYRRLFPAYAEIEPFWGAAPGELLTDGRDFFILGHQFGNVFVGLQPSFGYERDPMRLLMAKDAAPHHGFAAFYTWLEHIFGADAVLHFGTHGALEFMPGKQNGMTAHCWPTRLLGTLPNIYYYSVNNPSEATIAKRRSAATLVSHMVPPLQQAGLYKGLRVLKDALDTYRKHPNANLLEDIRAQAERLGLATEASGHIERSALGVGEWDTVERSALRVHEREVNGDNAHHKPNPHAPPQRATLNTLQPSTLNAQAINTPTLNAQRSNAQRSTPNDEVYIATLAHELILSEQRMIPIGLHVLGKPAEPAELADILALTATFVRVPSSHGREPFPPLPQLVASGLGHDYARLRDRLKTDRVAQQAWEQVDQIVRAACRTLVEGFCAGTAAQPQPGTSDFERELLQVAKVPPAAAGKLRAYLEELLAKMIGDRELHGLVHALESGYIPPSPGNDVVRNPAVVPTGRNIHGLDPFRVPTPLAQETGERLVDELLERLTRELGHVPESVAMVLWGTDNLKSDGEGVAQALALIGARPVVDELGKVSDVALIALEELGRPRVDVVITVSGIFRDLLGHQMGLLDRAARLAAIADEPPERNYVRKHALAQAAERGCTVEAAATRVFSNAPGSYGANVNYLVESGTWETTAQLGEAFVSRKSFAYGPRGEWHEARAAMESALATVDATFQNVDSFEVGISDIDHYYEYLGGVTRSVELLRGKRPPVILAEALTPTGRLSTLEQSVRLEARAKLLNPKWFEAMLAHGYQGVHEIETRVGNTYGWSATADAVEGWVYQSVAETFVLDEAMRERLTYLNPHSTAGIARRLLEASERGFWDADEATLDALRQIYADLEDRLEGIV
jgi:magnesium chelatase subunit H